MIMLIFYIIKSLTMYIYYKLIVIYQESKCHYEYYVFINKTPLKPGETLKEH